MPASTDRVARAARRVLIIILLDFSSAVVRDRPSLMALIWRPLCCRKVALTHPLRTVKAMRGRGFGSGKPQKNDDAANSSQGSEHCCNPRRGDHHGDSGFPPLQSLVS